MGILSLGLAFVLGYLVKENEGKGGVVDKVKQDIQEAVTKHEEDYSSSSTCIIQYKGEIIK